MGSAQPASNSMPKVSVAGKSFMRVSSQGGGNGWRSAC
jgi:hypothetical protein